MPYCHKMLLAGTAKGQRLGTEISASVGKYVLAIGHYYILWARAVGYDSEKGYIVFFDCILRSEKQ